MLIDNCLFAKQLGEYFLRKLIENPTSNVFHVGITCFSGYYVPKEKREFEIGIGGGMYAIVPLFITSKETPQKMPNSLFTLINTISYNPNLKPEHYLDSCKEGLEMEAVRIERVFTAEILGEFVKNHPEHHGPVEAYNE